MENAPGILILVFGIALLLYSIFQILKCKHKKFNSRVFRITAIVSAAPLLSSAIWLIGNSSVARTIAVIVLIAGIVFTIWLGIKVTKDDVIEDDPYKDEVTWF